MNSIQYVYVMYSNSSGMICAFVTFPYFPILLVQSYFMWDSFTSGVAISSMRSEKNGEFENDFAELEYMNITVITSNKPYGVHDGSNPFFDGHATPKFGLAIGGVHSGHVQIGVTDSFCHVKGSKKGKCEVYHTQFYLGTFADVTIKHNG
jgi:hypothetical protein